MKLRDRIKELRRVKASEILPNPLNWRTHPKSQQDALKGVLAEVGIADALLARETPEGLMLIDGHLRADSAPDAEWPVLVLDVTEAEAAKLLATIDPLAAMAETDPAKLDALLREVETGSEALATMLTRLAEDAGILDAKKADVTEDTVPDLPLVPVSKPGDLWLLAGHRVLCGDSTNTDDVSRLLNGAVPAVMVTDPPYGVEYDPKWRHQAGINKSKRTGKVSNDDRADWTPAWRLFPGNVAYVWHGGLHSAAVQSSLAAAGFITRAQIVWVKPRLVISRGHYHWKHEPAFYASRDEPVEPDVETDVDVPDECEESWYAVRKGATADWRGGRKQTTVWEIAFRSEAATTHGTQKPVECMARPIRNHGGKDDHVYDPFLGSGTTVIAAEQLERKCFGMELDPIYCDVIVKRWENLTGKKAILAT